MKTNKSFTINIPISKIDEEQRIVTGIATTEALDSQGDIMDYEASKRAFSEWKGNIREMHDPKAVGKAIDVQFDDVNKQVILSSYISESADGENAWTKVKEGILTGYSIGGRMLEVTKDKAIDGARRVTNYVLSETSLVDNPANPEAEFMMVKSFDGKLQEVETNIEPRKDMTKSIFEAQTAISIATELAYLMISETWEDEQDAEQLAALRTAFDAVREFTAREVLKDDDYLGEQTEVMERARQAINLRKETIMAKELEKANVTGGVERNEKAEVVEDLRPVEETKEVEKPVKKSDESVAEVVEAEVVTETVAEVAEPTEEVAEVEAEVAEPVAEKDTEEGLAEKSAEVEDLTRELDDLTKNMGTLLTKLDDSRGGAELKKMADDFSKLSDKVEKSLTSLEGRVVALEKQPLPTKAKATYTTIAKNDSEVEETPYSAAVKRQAEIIANPSSAKPGEYEGIARTIRNAAK